MMNFALKTRDFVLKTRHFVFKMITLQDFVSRILELTRCDLETLGAIFNRLLVYFD